MRSVVPSESATVPLPDHDPLKPVNGPDWAWLTDTDNMSAAPTPAALIACPNNLEPNNFISNFPIQMTFLCKPGSPDSSRTGLDIRGFPGSPQGRRAIRTLQPPRHLEYDVTNRI